ncbi:MAG: 50S ribosomal protein L21 [Cyanothece sp. SIO2G6]|nr:50S ribosomal protein L21 [Cyanothece sp. SIO2G6]
MAYAIVAASGTQLRVEPGRFYDVNRLASEEDDNITLDDVLFVNNAGEVVVGQPLVEGASVQATVMRHLRGRKIIVYKMQPKKKTRKKQGHRQELTRIMINSITLNGTVMETGETPSVTPAPAEEVTSPPAAGVDAAPVEETVDAAPAETAASDSGDTPDTTAASENVENSNE